MASIWFPPARPLPEAALQEPTLSPMAMRKNSALKKEMDFHPVLVNTQERDIYQLYRWWVQPVRWRFWRVYYGLRNRKHALQVHTLKHSCLLRR